MEVITIDGVEYVRAAVLARRHRYTSDYLGQLCRSGKVQAKLVGRTWYVNPDSVDGHKHGRYQKHSSAEKTSNLSVKKEISRVNVNAVLRSDPLRSIKSIENNSPQYLRRIEWKPVKYEPDNSELLPPLKTVAEPARVQITMAGATKVSVRKESGSTTLAAETLPEVALRGTLKVASVDNDFDSTDRFDNNAENIVISVDDNESVHLQPTSKDRDRSVEVHVLKEETRAPSSQKTVHDSDAYTYEVPLTVVSQPRRSSFTPGSVMSRAISPVNDEAEAGHVPAPGFVIVSLGILISCVLVLIVVSLDRELLATVDTLSTAYVFDIPF